MTALGFPSAALLAVLLIMNGSASAQLGGEAGLLGSAASPDAAAELYERALVEYNLGDVRTAYVYLRSALKDDPLLLPAHLLLSRIYLSLGQGEQAEKQLLIADGLGAHRALTQNSLARAYLMQGKAVELLDTLFPLGSAPEEDAELLALRGEAHLQLDQHFDAQRAFTQAWDRSPKSASAALGRVQTLLRQGKLEDALDLAMDAVEAAPGSPRAWYIKALLENALGGYAGALSDLERALELQPAYLPAQLLRLDVLIRLQRFDEAAAASAAIREVFPNDPRSYFVAAVVRAGLGQNEAARILLEDAATLLSRFPRELIEGHPPTLLLAGMVNFNLKRWRLAEDFLLTYLRRYPAALGPRLLLARIELDQRARPEQAITLLEPALTDAPDNKELLSMLAEAYIRTAQHFRASETLRRALREHQRDLLLRAQDAVNDYGLGRRTQAIERLGWVLSKRREGVQAGASMVIMQARQGLADEALAGAGALIGRAPGHLSTLNLFGTVAIVAGELAAARWAFALALLLDPRFHPARQNLAELALAEDRPAEAARQVGILLAEAPRDIPVLLLASRLANAQDDVERAIALARRAVSTDPSSADAVILLSKLLLQRRDIDAASTVLESALMRISNQDNFEMTLALGRTHLAAERTGPAQVALRRASALAGYETGLLVDIAELQRSAGDPQGRLWSLRKAVRGDPDSLLARIRLGEAMIEGGQVEEAKELAAELGDAYPAAPYADHLRGLLHLAAGDRDAALKRFLSALRKRSSALLAVRVHDVMRELNGVEKANAFLERWLAEHAGDALAARALAQGYFAAGRLREAQALFEQVEKQADDDPVLLNNMALVYVALGDPRALAYARNALERAPDSAQIIDTLGWVLVRSGELGDGLRYLREARARAGNDPTISYHLAVVLGELGRLQEALDEVQTALSGDVRFPERRSALKLRDALKAAISDRAGAG